VVSPIDPGTTDALLAAAQAGDRSALESLLRAHQPQVFAVCRRITGHDADAFDATQEALIAIVRGLPRFDGRSRFSTWVFRVATNACLDEVRRRNRRPLPGLPDDPGTGPQHTSDGPLLDETVAERMVVDSALAGLPPGFRAAVVLRDVCGLDYAEIADILDIPPGTVRSRIARGRAEVAKALGGNRAGSLAVEPSTDD
jgi:RNA polymerase sigma-70 factor, ECF subfamily